MQDNSTPDIRVQAEGNIWLFEPLSRRARQFFNDRIQSEYSQWHGPALIVDHLRVGSFTLVLRDNNFLIR